MVCMGGMNIWSPQRFPGLNKAQMLTLAAREAYLWSTSWSMVISRSFKPRGCLVPGHYGVIWACPVLSLPLHRFSSLNMRLSVYPSQYSPPRANWFPSGANDDDSNAHRMEEVDASQRYSESLHTQVVSYDGRWSCDHIGWRGNLRRM